MKTFFSGLGAKGLRPWLALLLLLLGLSACQTPGGGERPGMPPEPPRRGYGY